MTIVVLGVLLILVLVCICKYNKMIKYRNKVRESLSSIDIHLKLRFDLIPNLVNTVKGYAKHESELFESLIKVRNYAVQATDEKEKLEYANQLVPKMKQLLFVAENYPKLKADSLYKSLMEELVLIEDKIAASRRFYDSNVNAYNTLIETFPNSIIASMFGFKAIEMFKIDVGENINVKIEM